MPEFPPELVRRCAHVIDMTELSDGDPLGVALAENFRVDDLCETAEDVRKELDKVLYAAAIAVLRESGHAELVTALQTVLEWIKNWDPNFIYDEGWPGDREIAETALRKAGA